MSKNKLILFLAGTIIFIFSMTAFGQVLTDPWSIDTGDITLGTQYNSMEVHFTSILTQTYSAGITVSQDAKATLHSGFNYLKLTADSNVKAHAILVEAKTATDTPSLTIKADKFTLEYDNAAGIAPIFITKGGSLVVEGELEIQNNATNTYALNLRSEIDYEGSTATFAKNVILNSTDSSYSLGLHVGSYSGLSASVATFEKDLKITAKNIAITLSKGILEVKGDTEIAVSGNDAIGLSASTAGDTFTFHGDLSITTSGTAAFGVKVELYPTVTVGRNLTITTKNSSSYAIALIGNDSFQPNMSVTGKTTISTEKEASYAIYGQYAQGNFGETELNVIGSSSYGVYIISKVNQPAANITFNGVSKISVSGEKSYAAMVNTNSNIIFKKSAEISTSENKSHAIAAISGGRIVFEDGVSISTEGDGSHSILIQGGRVDFKKGASIVTKGIGSHGIYISQNGSVNFTNEDTIVGEVTISSKGTIVAEGTNADAIRFYSASTSSFKNVYAESKKRFVISNVYEQDIEATFTGESMLYGPIANQQDQSSQKYGTILLKLSDTSSWQGTTFSPGLGEVNLELSGNASWQIAQDQSYVDSIVMSNNSEIKFIHTTAGTFYTAEVDNLSGSGILTLNVDMSLSGSGDLLHVNNISGTYKLNVQDATSGRGGAERLTVITADSIASTLDITLLSGNKVRLGAYSYILESSMDKLTWDLVKNGVDEGIIKGTQISAIGFSEFAKSIDASLSDELLSLKKDIWIVANYKLQNFRNLPDNGVLKQNIYSVTTGIDLSENNIVDWGLFLGLNIGTQSINEIMEANLAAFTVGVNAFYAHNNFNISGYIRASSYSQVLDILDSPGELSGVASTFGFSSSVQAINKFYISDSHFYVAPKAKVSHTYILDFSHDFGPFEATYADADNLVSWLGVKVGNERPTKFGALEAYIEAGWAHDFNPEMKITIEEESIISINKNQFEIGIGLNANTSEKTMFSFEFKYSTGKNLVEPVKLKLAASTIF